MSPDQRPLSGRFICTAANPWRSEEDNPAVHPDAHYLGDFDHGTGKYSAHYYCPHCNHRFYVELI